MGNKHVFTSSVMLHKVSGSLRAVDRRKDTYATAGVTLHKVSESLRAVFRGNRHVCASAVILYEVSVSGNALDMSNGHVCTAGVMLHEAFGSLHAVELKNRHVWHNWCYATLGYLGQYRRKTWAIDTYVHLVLCYIRCLGRYRQ